ncbi:hypothetical protein Pst134EA_030592 [Puccinia striiformis f. sp. tritici]|uniref:hypothetical protein n=1 Tax=Puccinia striiformis f. sp. tritici TaxID=168172 RepID=UPI0020076200|nr:hypothetical protein Pst134EA_030592 [Puccinia striiformis f. sp. tritici]KAH9446683.1 hypothetical protein Pst134EA_030592 [Puccinia striiformis f. sp. tritici]
MRWMSFGSPQLFPAGLRERLVSTTDENSAQSPRHPLRQEKLDYDRCCARNQKEKKATERHPRWPYSLVIYSYLRSEYTQQKNRALFLPDQNTKKKLMTRKMLDQPFRKEPKKKERKEEPS